MPRTGRPVEGEPKDFTIKFRSDKSTREKMEYCAKVTGKSKSEIIREGVELVYNRLRKKSE